MSQDERIITLDGVEHHFPGDFTDAEIASALGPSKPEPGSNAALEMQAGAKAIPLGARAATAFAQSPNAAKTGGAIARGGTTAVGVIRGVMSGNPAQVIAAPMEGWAAGKGGYWLTKGAQSIAAPAGRILGKMAPYAQALSTASGIQGGLDLAQMAEPTRQDIGTFGIGPSVDVPGAHPPVINALLARIRASLGR